jgi:hypothetical protein
MTGRSIVRWVSREAILTQASTRHFFVPNGCSLPGITSFEKFIAILNELNAHRRLQART